MSFDAFAENPSDEDVDNTRITVYLFGDDTATAGLTAGQASRHPRHHRRRSP